MARLWEEKKSGGCLLEEEKGIGLPLHPMAFKLFSIVLALFLSYFSSRAFSFSTGNIIWLFTDLHKYTSFYLFCF